MTTITEAFRAGRASRTVRRRRTPLLVALVAWLGRTVPPWKRARTTVMQVAGFGAIDTALFGWHWIAGLVGIGVSLLILEALGGERA